MELKSKLLEIKKVKKKPTPETLKGLKVGDKIYLSLTMRNRTGYRGCYATYFNIHTEDGTVIYKQSQSVMKQVLDRAFVLEEVN